MRFTGGEVNQLRTWLWGRRDVPGPMPVFNVLAHPDVDPSGATDSTSALQALIDAAPAGSRFHFPDGIYTLNTELSRPAGRAIFQGNGNKTILRQTVWGRGVFDLYSGTSTTPVSGIVIEDMRLENTGTPAVITDSYRNGNSLRCSGVWLFGDNCTVRNCEIGGFVAGVWINNYDRNAATSLAKNNTVENVLFDDVDYGVLTEGTDGLRLSGLRGSFRVTQTGNPAHLIYLSFLAATNRLNKNVIVSDCFGYDASGVGDYAFQFKNVDGGTFTNLQARNCPGIVNCIGVTDAVFSNIQGHDLSGSSGGTGSFAMQGIGDARNTLSNIYIEAPADERALTLYGDDHLASNIHIRANHSTVGPTVTIQGSRTVVNDIHINNLGATANDQINVNASGADIRLINVTGKNARWLIVTTAGSTGTLIDANADLSTFSTGFVNMGGTGTIVRPRMFYGSASWGPNVANGATTSTTVTVTGAAVGDIVNGISFASGVLGDSKLYGHVTAANTVTVYLQNNSGGTLNFSADARTLRVVVEDRT